MQTNGFEDIEYKTQWLKERNYLTDHGIRYSFVSTDEKTNIRTFKYKKNSQLFKVLSDFYNEINK